MKKLARAFIQLDDESYLTARIVDAHHLSLGYIMRCGSFGMEEDIGLFAHAFHAGI